MAAPSSAARRALSPPASVHPPSANTDRALDQRIAKPPTLPRRNRRDPHPSPTHSTSFAHARAITAGRTDHARLFTARLRSSMARSSTRHGARPAQLARPLLHARPPTHAPALLVLGKGVVRVPLGVLRPLDIERVPVRLVELDAVLDAPDEVRGREEAAPKDDERVGVLVGGFEGRLGVEPAGLEERARGPDVVLRGREREGVSSCCTRSRSTPRDRERGRDAR